MDDDVDAAWDGLEALAAEVAADRRVDASAVEALARGAGQDLVGEALLGVAAQQQR